MNITDTLNEVIKKQLGLCDLDLVGMIPFPSGGDRMVRLKTLHEMVDEFEESNQRGVVGYFLQVKPKSIQRPPSPLTSTASSKLNPENVYLPNGKINIPYLVKNADLLFEAGDYALARNIYKAIVLASESSGPILFRLGRCLEAEGKLGEAKEKYEASIAYHPSLDAYQKLGALLIRQNKDREAAEVLERAMNLKDLSKPIRYELHKSCANCWTRAQHPEEAERHCKMALELNPAADEIRSNLGAIYLQKGDTQLAKKNFTDALASNPSNHLALAGLGSCYVAEGDFKSAHEYLSRSLELELNNPTAIYFLIRSAYETKTYAVAARVLEKYIQIAPLNPALLHSLAGLQFHVGRIPDAKNTALKILELQPQHSGAKELLEMADRFIGNA